MNEPETTQSDKESLARSIYGKRAVNEEGMERDVALMAAGSKLKIVPQEPQKPKPEPPCDLSEEALKKFVGGVFVRKNPGIYPGAKYTVTALEWSDKVQEFAVKRDSPALEYTMACGYFCRSMVRYEVKKPEPAPAPPAKGRRSAWSDK